MGKFNVLRYFAPFAVVLLSCSCSHARGSACDIVAGTDLKLLQTPYHSYLAMHVQLAAHGAMHDVPKALGMDHATQETIFAGGVIYDKSSEGPWHRSKVTVEAMAPLVRDEQKHTDADRTCRYIRDETIDGQNAQVYEIKSKNNQLIGAGTTHIWIAKASGLPLRQRSEVDANTYSELRYEYTNVQAPAGLQ